MSAAFIGILSVGGTVLAAVIGAGIMVILQSRTEKRADIAEAKAADADRLTAELGRWGDFVKALEREIDRLKSELEDERSRSSTLREQLDARLNDLRAAKQRIAELEERLA